MATTTITNIGYTGTIQNATVTGEFGIPVNAHLWGAGGGSSNANGNAGGYSKVYFIAKPGDILTVAVGQGGGRGGPNINPSTPSGFPGAAYSGLLFNSRYPPPGTAVYPYGNGTSFLDQWGVWGPNQNDNIFLRQYSIRFPTTANVIFQVSCNNSCVISLDGNPIINRPPGMNPNTISEAFVNVTSGTRILTISAQGTVGALNRVGVIFGTGDQTTFAGGHGGQSDNERGIQNGAGGGGGGATILSLNDVVIGVAAGGAGGATRPATSVSTDYRYNNGQDGQDLIGFNGQGDAGPGGGGGGGLWGGQGGAAGGGGTNVGGVAGFNGTSQGDERSQPIGRQPFINSLYPGGNVATGGLGLGYYSSGGNGAVVLEYQTGGGGYVKDDGSWKAVQTAYVKDAGVWKPIQTTYINENGVWKPIQGVPVPTFTQFYGAFAPASRSFGSRLTPPPPPPAPDYGGYNTTGYGDYSMF